MSDDKRLQPVSRNYLKKGDKIRMKNGELFTIKFTDFAAVYVIESVFPVSKKDIETILELKELESKKEKE